MESPRIISTNDMLNLHERNSATPDPNVPGAARPLYRGLHQVRLVGQPIRFESIRSLEDVSYLWSTRWEMSLLLACGTA